MTISPLALTFIPVVVATLGAAVAVRLNPAAAIVSAVQHFAAGVVFAAAAVEVLPDLMHYKAPVATLIGGGVGLALMLTIMQAESRWEGPIGMLATTTIDLLVDGFVIGIAFLAGAKAGVLLTVALTLEVLFLGLTTANAFGGAKAKMRSVIGTGVLMLAMPLGVLIAEPVSQLPAPVIAGCLAFGLIALLYLVTEELLVEAHEKPDKPWITSLFFVGFLTVLLLDEWIAMSGGGAT